MQNHLMPAVLMKSTKSAMPLKATESIIVPKNVVLRNGTNFALRRNGLSKTVVLSVTIAKKFDKRWRLWGKFCFFAELHLIIQPLIFFEHHQKFEVF